MNIAERRIDEVMTPLPHAIGSDQTVAAAARRMHELGIRHLPVLERGRLVGIVSDADVMAVVASTRPETVRLDTVMRLPLAVRAEMTISETVRLMAEWHADAAVVVDGEAVVGVVTSTDALHVLASLLEGLPNFDRASRPSVVKQRVLSEHRLLRHMVCEVEAIAERAQAGEAAAEPELRNRARALCRTFKRHLDLEDAILVPILRESDAYGPQRAERLEREHAEQRRMVADVTDAIDNVSDVRELASRVLALAREAVRDMKHEENDALRDDLIRDDGIQPEIFTG